MELARRFGGLFAIGLALGALAAPVAEAQTPAELAEARTLFTRGLSAAREARWGEARDLFEQSLAITERASTLLNLASALAETGALRESARRYERFLEIASGRDAQHRDQASAALERVRARTPLLTLDTTALRADDDVAIDGESVEHDAPVPLDPGSHHVVVQRGPDTVFEAHVVLEDSAREQLVLTPRAVAPSPAEVAAASDPVLGETGGGDDAIAIGVGVGVGVAVLAVVAIVIAVVLAGEGQSPYAGNLGGGVIRY